MAPIANWVAGGIGWRVEDVVCTAGPQDRPFEEQHDGICIAAVTQGTFRYRTAHGAAVLAAGAVLLGNDHGGFECDHEHSRGDRCLSFHFTPEFLDTAMAPASGGTRMPFRVNHLPPLGSMLPIVAACEAARGCGDDAAHFEELAIALAGSVLGVLSTSRRGDRLPSARDERRIADVVHRIEEASCELRLAELARGVSMSPWHFLRTFRAVVGTTPHRFILQRRLHNAAIRLRLSTDSVSEIAWDEGFDDLSTFNRHFKRVMGVSPTLFRTHAPSTRFRRFLVRR